MNAANNRTPRQPTAQFDPSGQVTLTFPYDRALIEQLKVRIPPWARTYDPEVKAWTVRSNHAAIAITLLRVSFPDATVLEDHGRRPEPEPIRPSDQLYAVLHLLPSAPEALLDAAFRLLARRHHPDVAGGDRERMREINTCYETLRAIRERRPA